MLGKERKALCLAPQACAYPAEREERNKKWFLMPVAPNTKLTPSIVKMLCTVTPHKVVSNLLMPMEPPKARSLRDLLVWQKSHQCVLALYAFTAAFPKQETYGLSAQRRRAAISIPAKIAEGFRRRGKPDRLEINVHCLSILAITAILAILAIPRRVTAFSIQRSRWRG
jgi:hypothetical protein